MWLPAGAAHYNSGDSHTQQTKSVRRGPSDEGSSWGCAGREVAFQNRSNQMLIRLKWPPSDALGSRWEAGTVPRGQVGCAYARLLF